MRVRDSGCGIPEEVLPRIFDPFFTTKEDQMRTGLGLAVACTASWSSTWGLILVDSKRPGEGTEFTVRLPAGSGRRRVKPVSGGGAAVSQRGDARRKRGNEDG